MNKAFNNFINMAGNYATDHASEILLGLGTVGMWTAGILAVTATPKATRLIIDAENEKGAELTKVEVAKAGWRPYVPAAVTAVVSTACLIGSGSVSARRNAALATAYQIVTTNFAEYKEQVVESVGEKKEKAVREKAAQKKLDKHPEVTQQVIITGNGETLFVDPTSMRSFTCDLESLRSIVNDLNERMTCGMEEFISLSEFYDEIGLPHTDVSDDIGWNLGRDGQIKMNWYPCTDPNTKKPAFMLDFLVAPRRGFEKLL